MRPFTLLLALLVGCIPVPYTACPGAYDVPYNGRDDDCDGFDLTDVDGDGHEGMEVGGDDCDDDAATLYPGAPEVPYDGVDQDCDGADLLDVDGDGHEGMEAGGDDCDDYHAAAHPGGSEVPYNGIDEDCNGADRTDVDGDGHDADVVGGDDCDDGDPTIYARAVETPNDGIDQDCDGVDLTHVTTVCGDGSGDFLTVQDGVDGTPNGGTIGVCPGSYDEAVTLVDRALTISGTGEQAADVVFSYSGYYALEIRGEASDVTIRNVSFSTANLGGNAAGNVAFDRVDFCANNTSGDVYLYFPYGGSAFSVERSRFCPSGYAYLQSWASVVRFQENVVQMAAGTWTTLRLEGDDSQVSNNLISGGTLTIAPGLGRTKVFNNTFADGDAFTIAVWDESGRNQWEAFDFHNNIVSDMTDPAAWVFNIGYLGSGPDCSIYVPRPFSPNASSNLTEGWLTCTCFDEWANYSYSEDQAPRFASGFTDEDPMFTASPGQGDYALDPASPCVDAGSGRPDPDGSPADLGAFGGPAGHWWQRVPWLP